MREVELAMAGESSALAHRPESEAPSESDYHAILVALSASARGRWFLDEYARRGRKSDTAALTAALDRIEARVNADTRELTYLRGQLRVLLPDIRHARVGLNTGGAVEVSEFAAFVDVLASRIEALIGGGQATLPHGSASPRPAEGAEHKPDEGSALMPSACAPGADNGVPATKDPLAEIMALNEFERLALFT